MADLSALSDMQLLSMAKVPPSKYTDAFLHHLHTKGPDVKFDKQAYDTRTFQQYDPNNATAQRQIGSSAIGAVLPNNPYRAEAEKAALSNVYNVMTDPTMAITTFHGSPTSGIRKFDMNFRGTGEGRLEADSPLKESFKDMIAHGLYTAENHGIAKGYQERLGGVSSDFKTFFDGKPVEFPKYEVELQRYLNKPGYDKNEVAGMFDTYIADAKRFKRPDDAAQLERIKADYLSAKDIQVQSPGSTYTTELLPHPDEYLHWDKPLGEQPKAVKDALVAGMREKLGMQYDAIPDGSKVAGQSAYRRFAEAFGSDKAASEYLDSLGIKGVKYLDGSSRSAGEGMHNYVTFRPETESIITHENGQRIPGAVEEAYAKVRDPESKRILEERYPELKGYQ